MARAADLRLNLKKLYWDFRGIQKDQNQNHSMLRDSDIRNLVFLTNRHRLDRRKLKGKGLVFVEKDFDSDLKKTLGLSDEARALAIDFKRSKKKVLEKVMGWETGATEPTEEEADKLAKLFAFSFAVPSLKREEKRILPLEKELQRHWYIVDKLLQDCPDDNNTGHFHET